MCNQDWMDEMYRRAKTDDWHQTLQGDVDAAEPAFLTIRNSLPQAQQEQLDTYVAACEELEHSLALIAYELGREQGKITVIPPAK